MGRRSEAPDNAKVRNQRKILEILRIWGTPVTTEVLSRYFMDIECTLATFSHWRGELVKAGQIQKDNVWFLTPKGVRVAMAIQQGDKRRPPEIEPDPEIPIPQTLVSQTPEYEKILLAMAGLDGQPPALLRIMQDDALRRFDDTGNTEELATVAAAAMALMR